MRITGHETPANEGGRGGYTKFFFRKLMSPLVEESWELTAESSCSSGSIFLANCFPSSTLAGGNRKLVERRRSWPRPPPHSPPLVVAVDVPDDALHEDLVLVHGWKQNERNHFMSPSVV